VGAALIPVRARLHLAGAGVLGIRPSDPGTCSSTAQLLNYDRSASPSTAYARGGHWITADIYVQSAERSVVSEQTRQFLDAHHVEDNKFGDFELAERWVVDHGLAIANRGVRGRIRETWALAI